MKRPDARYILVALTVLALVLSWLPEMAIAQAPEEQALSVPVGTHAVTLTVPEDQGARAADTVHIKADPYVSPASTMRVSDVFYYTEGRKQVLRVRVTVVDGDDAPVSGVSVGYILYRNGAFFSVGAGTTSDLGIVTFSPNRSPAGCYTESLSLSHPSRVLTAPIPAVTGAGPFCK